MSDDAFPQSARHVVDTLARGKVSTTPMVTVAAGLTAGVLALPRAARAIASTFNTLLMPALRMASAPPHPSLLAALRHLPLRVGMALPLLLTAVAVGVATAVHKRFVPVYPRPRTCLTDPPRDVTLRFTQGMYSAVAMVVGAWVLPGLLTAQPWQVNSPRALVVRGAMLSTGLAWRLGMCAWALALGDLAVSYLRLGPARQMAKAMADRAAHDDQASPVVRHARAAVRNQLLQPWHPWAKEILRATQCVTGDRRAVLLRYVPTETPAPVLLAWVPERQVREMLETAVRTGVSVTDAPAVLRALRGTAAGKEIPARAYGAVAAITRVDAGATGTLTDPRGLTEKARGG